MTRNMLLRRETRKNVHSKATIWTPILVALLVSVVCSLGHAAVNTSTAPVSDAEVRSETNARYERMVTDYWSVRNEWVRKGRIYPLSLHAWLAELAEVYEKEGESAAVEYCVRRKIRTEGGRIVVAVEHKGWFGRKQKAQLQSLGEVLEEPTRLGVVIRIPFVALRGLLHEKDIMFARPMPLPDEAERLSEKETASREIRLASRGKEEFRYPDGSVSDVVSGVVVLNFRPIDAKKAREILRTYGCWIVEYSSEMEHGKYVVGFREGDSLGQVLNGLGHDPEVSFLQPSPLVVLSMER